MSERIRVLRVLEYEGPREWVESAIAQRSVKGERSYNPIYGTGCIIRESIIGETPVVLKPEPEPLSTASGRKAERQMARQLREQEGKRIYHKPDCDILRWPHDKCNCGVGYDVIG